MNQEDYDATTIPDTPGVYLFRDTKRSVLYVGRAVNLRQRVRSYFSERLEQERGVRLTEMVQRAKTIETRPTESVLEAYLLEAHLIKRYEPLFNVRDKDNTSFQYVGITEEAFPRILVIRGRQREKEAPRLRHCFGPFPRGALLKEALRVLRRVFPYRDTCTPYDKTTQRPPRKCFRAQLNLCPGMCAGAIGKREYARRIQDIVLFFTGKRHALLKRLERQRDQYSKKREFEKAEEIHRRIFALTHIQDASLIQNETTTDGEMGQGTRIEAYDIAHLGGKDTVGGMSVLIDGEPEPSEYRTFTIQNEGGDDHKALREVLTRRFAHAEWRYPHLIVMDGGKTHLALAESIVQDHGLAIPVVTVVKNERHAPRAILGKSSYKNTHEQAILKANAEVHRYTLARHKRKRNKRSLQNFKNNSLNN